MPHDKSGKEAKVGDFVKFVDQGETHIGRVDKIYPGTTTCNATVSHVIHVPQATIKTVTLSETELVHAKEYKADVAEDAKV